MIHSHSVTSPTLSATARDLEYVVCDYCGSDQTATLATLPPVAELLFPMHRLGAMALHLEGESIHFCRCQVCGLVYMNPRLTEAAIARFYDKVYATPGAAILFESNAVEFTQYLLDTASQLLKAERPSILDIGCGAGQLLLAAQRRGWTIYGSELSSVAAERARATLNNDSIYLGDFREMGLAPQSLDAVAMMNVVEHLRAPVNFLRDSAALLKPGGLLIFNVPNVISWEYRLASSLGQTWRGFIIEHLYYFSPAFLECLMRDLGLEIAVMSSYNPTSRLPNPLRDVSSLLRSRLSADVAQPAQNPLAVMPPLPQVSPLRRVLRQANNYLLDTVSVLSEGRSGGSSLNGNGLYLWALKPEQTFRA